MVCFEAADRLCTRRHVQFAASEYSNLQKRSTAFVITQSTFSQDALDAETQHTGADVSATPLQGWSSQCSFACVLLVRVGLTLPDAD